MYLEYIKEEHYSAQSRFHQNKEEDQTKIHRQSFLMPKKLIFVSFLMYKTEPFLPSVCHHHTFSDAFLLYQKYNHLLTTLYKCILAIISFTDGSLCGGV